MIYNLVRKGGIPALARPTSDATSHLPCFLSVKYSETGLQATISLQVSLPIHGFDDEQTFTLLYHGDNLVPGKTSLEINTESLPQDVLQGIARQGNPQPRTLSLALKEPCPIWCPPSSAILAPKHGSDSFHQLVKLAGVIHLNILFDYNWVNRSNHERFQQIINHPERLTAVPDDENSAKLYRQTDSSIFGPVDELASEAPPPYINVPRKRSAASSTPEPSSLKRVLLSPAHIFPPSPTEKATTASTPSSELPSPRITDTSHLQDSIQHAVAAQLPEVVRSNLLDLLPRLFAPPSSSPSPSPSLNSTSLNSTSNALSSLGTLISTHAAAYVEAKVQQICAEAVDRAEYLQSAANVDFLEVIDEHKLDLTMLKDDGIAELGYVTESKVVELKERSEDIIEELDGHADEVYNNFRDRLGVLADEATYSRCEREMLEKEVLKRVRESFDKDRLGTVLDDSRSLRQSRRAISMPL